MKTSEIALVQRMAQPLKKAIRILYPRGSVRRICRGPLAGMKFMVTPGMGATYAWGVDSMNFSSLQKRIRPGATVYDIGANCGQMALLFARLAGPEGKVLSFEPVPGNFEILQTNLSLNPEARVQAFCTALGRDSESKEFCFDPQKHTMGTFASTQVGDNTPLPTLRVACTTLDDVVESGESPPNYIKIDVEGSGGEVLAGAERTVEKYRPAIYFEIHAAAMDSPELLALHRLRERWGYSLMDLSGTPITSLTPMWGPALWCEPPKI